MPVMDLEYAFTHFVFPGSLYSLRSLRNYVQLIGRRCHASLGSCVLSSHAPAHAPTPTPPSLENVVAKGDSSSCTFSGSLGYSIASVPNKSCSTIVHSDLQVPRGKTLNLEKLNTGTGASLSPWPLHRILRI